MFLLSFWTNFYVNKIHTYIDMLTSNLLCIINIGRNSTKSNFKICNHIEVGLRKRERREKIWEKSWIFVGNFCPKSSKILNFLSEI